MLTAMCIAAANYIIRKTNDFNKGKKYSDRISMTCKRLQKLLYFSEIEYMKQNSGQPMLKENFHAWPSGPVIPSVYDVFVQYQDGEMYPVDEAGHSKITPEMIKALESVFKQTINTDTLELVEFSHIPGGPWATVYNPNDQYHTQIIDKQNVFSFYKNRSMFSL